MMVANAQKPHAKAAAAKAATAKPGGGKPIILVRARRSTGACEPGFCAGAECEEFLAIIDAGGLCSGVRRRRASATHPPPPLDGPGRRQKLEGQLPDADRAGPQTQSCVRRGGGD